MTDSVPPRSIHGEYARLILNEYHGSIGAIPKLHPLPNRNGNPIKVGILGAGAAGLYAAMLLDDVNKNFNTNFEFDVLEANPKRLGGRLWSQSIGDTPGPNDYIDVGAMRFPDIPIMNRTLKLFDNLGITEANKSRIEYVMQTDEDLFFFNETLFTRGTLPPDPDPFHTGELPADKTADAAVAYKIDLLKTLLETAVNNNQFQQDWSILLNYGIDDQSMRTFMASPVSPPPQYTQQTINTLETFESGTRFYDTALLEMIMEDITFHWYSDPPKEPKIPWWTVQGGSSVIASAMASRVKDHIKMGNAVTSISPNLDQNGHWVSVNVEARDATLNTTTSTTYDHVINTMPFGCFARLDTSKCNFGWDLRQAIRALQYGNSVKVGIRFKSRWWETDKGHNGGVSYTDRPTRMVVYPSYGRDQTTGATMIVSYCWGQDADRLGALCQGYNTDEEKQLVNLILKDLSDMHGYDDYSILENLVDDYFAWNWDMNVFSAGAFALFGPGQFRSLYPKVTASFEGLLHFAGEATSVHHAWLVGALNSAFRTVYEILYAEGLVSEKDHAIFDYLWNTWGWDEEFDQKLYQTQIRIGRPSK